jgi:pilus assembly protein CpaB
MKAARLVVLGVALAAGGVAALLAGGHHEAPPSAPSAPPPPPLATVDILVAKNDLSRGQVIGEGDVDWQTWPAASANANFIKRADRPDAPHQFTGAIVRQSLMSGEPILEPAVVFAKSSGFMAAILPKGMRAVSMEVSAENAAGGFILPDDHVDVMLTRHDKVQTAPGGAGDRIVSESILRNVRVLAIDQAVEEKAGQKVVVGKTATLELSPDQAETLQMARQQGTLTLALRSLADSRSDAPEEEDESSSKKRLPINTVRYGVSSVSSPR